MGNKSYPPCVACRGPGALPSRPGPPPPLFTISLYDCIVFFRHFTRHPFQVPLPFHRTRLFSFLPLQFPSLFPSDAPPFSSPHFPHVFPSVLSRLFSSSAHFFNYLILHRSSPFPSLSLFCTLTISFYSFLSLFLLISFSCTFPTCPSSSVPLP